MNKAENLDEIKGLSLHYPRRQLSQQDFARWLEDYANDLAVFSPADIRLACIQWRQSDARRMPTPGELIAKVNSMRGDRSGSRYIEPPRPRVVKTAEERESVRKGFEDLIAQLSRGGNAMDFNRLARRPGETPAEQAERLWPNRRIDRVRAHT
jgi:hypothetical protein